ncbi:M67 family metallopeptidase [Patulibacter sp. NPDC049589]|uniref:M67 family metallopeptidase n=1 Tax=Patulibacter sp. NPDC049589 TaxID=3154731 RepID=UPI00341EF7EF
MRIPRSLLDQVVAHALRDAPDECCGLLAVRDDIVVGVHELENVLQGPKVFGFELGGRSYPRAMLAIDDEDAEAGVLYHSHTRSAPYPSQTDINFGRDPQRLPGVEWLIIGTKGAEPEVRSYLIAEDGEVTEVAVDVLDD